jgi:hypothetical protein
VVAFPVDDELRQRRLEREDIAEGIGLIADVFVVGIREFLISGNSALLQRVGREADEAAGR